MKLYKYRPLNDYTDDVIVNSRIYFPTIDRLNDPCELVHPVEFNADIWDADFQAGHDSIAKKTRIAALIKGEEISQEEAEHVLTHPESRYRHGSQLPDRDGFEELYDELEVHEALKYYVLSKAEDCATLHRTMDTAVANINAKLKGLGILSLSRRSDSQLMFAHYAADHTGVVLEFESNDDPMLRAARPIEYLTTRPRITASNILAAIYAKSSDWEYEAEYRVLQKIGNTTYYFNPDALTGIIFGCRVSTERRQRILDSLNKARRTLALFQATSDPHTYSITVHSL